MPEFYNYQWRVRAQQRNDINNAFFNRGRDNDKWKQFSLPADENSDNNLLELLGIPVDLQDGNVDPLCRDHILTVGCDGNVKWEVVQNVADLAIGTPSVGWLDLTDSPGFGDSNGQYLTNSGGSLSWVDAPSNTEITPPATATPGQIPTVDAAGNIVYQTPSFVQLSDTPTNLGSQGQTLQVNNGQIVWANPAPATEIAVPPNTDPGSIPVVQNDGTIAYEELSLTDLADTPGANGAPGTRLGINAAGAVAWLPAAPATSMQAPVGTPGGSVLVAAPDGTTSFRPLNFTELGQTPSSLGTATQVLVMNQAGTALVWADQDELQALPIAPVNTPAGSVPTVQNDGSVSYSLPTFVSLSDTPNALGQENQILTIEGGLIRWRDADDALAASGNALTTTFSSLSDTPASIAPGQLVVGSNDGSSLQYLPVANLATQVVNSLPPGSTQIDKIAPGADSQVLTTVGNTVRWSDPSTITSTVTNNLTPGSVPSNSIAPGTNGQLYVTQNGVATWSDASVVANSIATSITNNALPTNKLVAGQDGQVLVTSANTVTWANLANVLPDVKDEFLELLDTPSSYSGWESRPLIVSPDGSGIEFGQFPAAADLASSLNFVDLQDTPATITANQMLVANAAGNGLVFQPVPNAVDTLVGLSDTPNSLGSAGQLLQVNAAGTATEWVTPAAPATVIDSFVALTDTPNSIAAANAGQVVRVNAAGSALEFVAPTAIAATTFIGLSDTPASWGTAEQILQVNAATNALEWVDKPANITSVTELDDTPDSFAAADAGRPLVLNAAGDALEFGSFPAPPSGAADFVSLTDTPSSITANQMLVANAAGTALAFQPVPTTVDTFTALTDTPGTLGSANQIVSVNGAGTALVFTDLPASNFLALTDTPGTYTAESFLRVNPAGNAVEFFTPTFVENWLDLADTPAAYQANKNVVTNAAGDAVELVDIVESVAICEFLTDESIENRDPGLVTFVVPQRLNGYTITKVHIGIYEGGTTFDVAIVKRTAGANANLLPATSIAANAFSQDMTPAAQTIATNDILLLVVSGVSGTAPKGLTVTMDFTK